MIRPLTLDRRWLTALLVVRCAFRRYAVFMVRAFVAFATVGAVVAVSGLPCTSGGWFAVTAGVLGAVAVAARPPWRGRAWIVCLLGGLASCAGCLHDANLRRAHLARIVAPSPAASVAPPTFAQSMLPASASASLERTATLSGAVVDEEAVALLGARFAIASGRIPAPEAAGLLAVMKDGYHRMKKSDGRVPTPMARWMAGATPEAMVIEPDSAKSPETAVIFLHGWGGTWALPCWQVAQAARRVDALTLCPATGFAGDWWSEEGASIARRAVEAVRSRGAVTVILVGLSNGGIGASLIAPKLAHEIDGLVLISGASPSAGRSGVPTLVLHGTQDHMVPVAGARQYSRRTGAKFAAFDGTHFVLLEKHEEMTAVLEGFLVEVTGRPCAKSKRGRAAPR